MAEINRDYRIRPLDVIRFDMFAEPDNCGEYRVSREGNLELFLIGSVPVKGKTISEAKEFIEKRYREEGYYVNPQVGIRVVAYAERRVYVSGYVNNPGPVLIPIEEELTLGKAIDAARGTQPRAAYTVKVTRIVEGQPHTWSINLRDIQEGRAPDVPLEEDDRIYVPDSTI